MVDVAPGTPAHGVGLRAGDLIVAVDDVDVASVSDLKTYVYSRYLEGQREFTLTVVRGRTRYRLKVEVP